MLRVANAKSLVGRLSVLAIAVATAAAVRGGEDSRSSARDDPGSPGYVSGSGGRRHTDAEREKLIAAIERSLAELKPLPPAKNAAENDYFVIGTAEMADGLTVVNFVNFLTIAGQHETATAIADFLLDAGRGAKRYWQPMGRVKNETAAKKLLTRAQAIEKQVAAFPLAHGGKKSPGDAFAVGTAELHLNNGQADIRFQVIQGTKRLADFLIAYILAAPDNTQRQWHVFSRAKTTEEADQYVAQLRSWYDALESQRQSIAAIYHARTTRRC
jgi:hypothetical protein